MNAQAGLKTLEKSRVLIVSILNPSPQYQSISPYPFPLFRGGERRKVRALKIGKNAH